MDRRSALMLIGKQMNIPRCSIESDKMYHARITYSALGMWMRMFAATANQDGAVLSKGALHRKVSLILHNFIELDRDIAEWYFPSNSSNPIKSIRSTLLRSGDLISQGFNSGIGCSSTSLIPFSKRDMFIRGYVSPTSVKYAAGLACVAPNRSENLYNILTQLFNIPLETAHQQIEAIKASVKWQKIENVDKYEFFDPRKKAVFSSCWTRFLPLCPGEIYVSRYQFSFGVFEYQMTKIENETYYVAPFSSYSQHDTIRETQRLLYAVKSEYGVNAAALAERGSIYTIWHFWSRLPPAEEALLQYIAWPLENVDNTKNEYLIRNELNFLLEEMAANLNIDIEERSYE